MKTLLTAIVASLVFGLTAIAEPTNSQSQIAPQMISRSYKIMPGTFFSSLKQEIVPKDGESNQQLLVRYFEQQHIDLDVQKAAVFVDEKLGRLFVRAPQP